MSPTSEPQLAAVALLRCLYKTAEGEVCVQEEIFGEYRRLLAEALDTPRAIPVVQQVVKGLAAYIERLGPTCEALVWIIHETDALLAPWWERVSPVLQEAEASQLDEARRHLALISPPPSGEPVQPAENIPFSKPTSFKG